MNRFARIAAIALGAGLVSAAPAAADYSIETDAAYPSVVFIEFDPDTIPMVYTAPGGSTSIPVIGGGATTDGSGDAGDMAPAVQDQNTTSSNNQSASSSSVDDRAEQRVKDLMNSSPQEIEDMIVNRKIEDQVLKDVDLNQ